MRIPKEKRKMPIPYLEISFAFFSIYAAILFFMSDIYVFHNIQVEAAVLMLQIMPPIGWGVVFLLAALLLSVGLVSNWVMVRFAGLFVNILTFIMLAACHSLAFPNLTFGLFTVLALTGIGALFTVKQTEL